MALKKTKSHRKSGKIQRIIKKKTKAMKKRLRKQKKATKNLKKDPGIPNLYPFKKELLKKIIKNKNAIEAQKLLKKQSKKLKSSQNQPSQNSKEALNPNLEENASENVVKDQITPKNKKYTQLLNKVVNDSDVILFVLDARDPNGCRDRKLEAIIKSKESVALGGSKKVVLVINKIDLVPASVSTRWVEYLKNELPVVAFKASTQGQRENLSSSKTSLKNLTDKELSHTKLAIGTENLLSLLKNYSRSFEKTKKPISVGVVGYPNVGKSSIINSLKRKKIASTSPLPGHTKDLQEITLDKRLRLVDSPGVLFESGSNYSSLVLKNSVRVEKIKQPEDFVAKILEKCPKENLSEIYGIPIFETTSEFLYLIANKKGILGKGGKVNVDATSRAVIRDWNSGKISYYTSPPNASSSISDTIKIKTKWGTELNMQELIGQSREDIVACEMRQDNDIDETKNFIPIEDDKLMEDE